MNKRFIRRGVVGVAAGTILVLGLAACGVSGNSALQKDQASPTGQSEAIVVGSANFTESQILAEIYAAALNKRGIAAKTRPSIGAREAYIGALKEGSVGVVPEYGGSLLLFLDTQSKAKDPAAITAEIGQKLDPKLKALTPSKAEDKDTLVVTKDSAAKYGLKSFADLAAHSKELKLGAPPEFATRTLPRLASEYKFEPREFVPINDGAGPLTVKALKDGTVQVADIFTTDPAIKANDFVALDDPQHFFPAEQVVPLTNAKLVNDAAAKVLDEVSAVLTTDDLVALNSRVSGSEKAAPAKAAADWVAQKIK